MIFPIITVIFLFFSVYGIIKKVDILSAFKRGVFDGIETLKTVFPNLVFILSAVYLITNSGFADFVTSFFSPLLSFFKIPSEVFPLFLIRPFSGSGSLSVLRGIYSNCGAESYAAFLASVISASTETTFYTISLYLSPLTKKTGKITAAALFLDLLSFLTAAALSPFFYSI